MFLLRRLSRCLRSLRTGLCLAGVVTLVLKLVLVLQVVLYITEVRLGINRDREMTCINALLQANKSSGSRFPEHIHQIFLNRMDLPKPWSNAQRTWPGHNPYFRYTVWNSSMVVELMRTYYPGLLVLYNAYSHWVMQVDVARLVILHHHGGIYVDMDVGSSASLDTLFRKNSKYDTVLYYTKPVGVATDFIVSKQGSAFVAHVLCGLAEAQRTYLLPYVTEMLSTGPLFIYLRYLVYRHKDDIKILHDNVISDYISHVDGRSWHQWDGVAIWWIFVHRNKLFLLVPVVVCVGGLIVIGRKVPWKKVYIRTLRRLVVCICQRLSRR